MPPAKTKKKTAKPSTKRGSSGKRVTIRSVAEAAGVSIATVSFVLNKRSGQIISEPVKKKVLEAARKLDYAPSAAAATLARKHTANVAIVFYLNDHLITNQFYSFVLQGAIKEAADNEFNIMFSFMHEEFKGYEDLPKVIREKNAEGVLLVQQVSEPLVAEMKAKGVAVVGVDCHPHLDGLDSFYVDNEKGATLACQRLIDDGHEHIVMLTGGTRGVVSLDRRRTAFLKTLKAAGLNSKVRDAIVKADALSFQAAYRQALELLQSRPEVTGIFCANDEMAAGVLRAAHELNRKIPDELSVIGFDDIIMSHYVDPPLSTISSNKEEIGRRAMAHLLTLIDKKPRNTSAQQLIDVEFEQRGSSGPLAK